VLPNLFRGVLFREPENAPGVRPPLPPGLYIRVVRTLQLVPGVRSPDGVSRVHGVESGGGRLSEREEYDVVIDTNLVASNMYKVLRVG
jgi:hypothetical protein